MDGILIYPVFFVDLNKIYVTICIRMVLKYRNWGYSMLNTFEEHLLLFTKGRFGDYEDIQIEHFVSYLYDIRVGIVDRASVLNILTTLHSKIYPNFISGDVLKDLLYRAKLDGRDAIDVEDMISYFWGKLSVVPAVLDDVDVITVADVNESFVKELRSIPY